MRWRRRNRNATPFRAPTQNDFPSILLNQLTASTARGRLAVMSRTMSQAANVALNGTNALWCGQAAFAVTHGPPATTYTAAAQDRYG